MTQLKFALKLKITFQFYAIRVHSIVIYFAIKFYDKTKIYLKTGLDTHSIWRPYPHIPIIIFFKIIINHLTYLPT